MTRKKVVTLSRRYPLSYAHKLISAKEMVFHGHSAFLIVTLKGSVNSESGLIVNRSELDKIINDLVLSYYNKKILNFICLHTSGEWLCKEIYYVLKKSDQLKDLLYTISLQETEKNFFSYPGPT
jgi:6-pyruvoyl-tetrahydropterin synthase